MSYGVIPFRFGRAAAEPTSPNMCDFYQSVAEMCIGRLAVPTNPVPPIALPLTYEMMSDALLLYSIASKYVEPWIANSNLILIDLANPADQILPNHHIVASIAELVRTHPVDQHGTSRRFVVLLSTMLAPSDPVAKSIDELIEAGRLALIADDGASVKSVTFGGLASEMEYVRALASARGTPEEAIRRKLIRFPGHFKRYDRDAHTHCTNYYFDGRLCQAELVNYLDSYARKKIRHGNVQVVYHSTISHWLSNAVEAFGKRRALVVRNLATDAFLAEGASTVILVVPLVDSGATIRSLYERIAATSPTADIHILSILTAQGDALGPGKLKIESNGRDILVDYAVKVAQKRFSPKDCPFCKGGMEISSTSEPDPFDKLSVHAFWTLATELGFQMEENVPPYRSSRGTLPAFKRVDHNNGPYLAYKVVKLLRAGGRQLPANPIIVCPAEDGVGAIASWLETVFGMTVIKIPKSALPPSDYPPVDLSMAAVFSSTSEPWLTQLRSLQYFKQELTKGRLIFGQPNYSVIVLDEINVSGKSRYDLCSLVEKFGLEVLCKMSLLDFAATSPDNKDDILSLYDIEIQSDEIERGAN